MEASTAGPRVARGEADADRVAEIITAAFHHDPVWGWAFPDESRRSAQHAVFWRFHVDAAIPHEWIWLSANRGAAAIWLPPGVPELSEQDVARLGPMLTALVGPAQAGVLMEIADRFEAAHPHPEPHYYLSLLGTHPDHRGNGIGVQLVADNLELIDASGTAAYLESTNPANNARYERLGFTQIGEFSLPGDDAPPVATMWRDAHG